MRADPDGVSWLLRHDGPVKTLARRVVPLAWRPHIKRVQWWGLRHHCLLCGSRVRRYLPEGYTFPVLRELDVVGGEHWPERICPVCMAGTRSRLIWWYLQTETRLLHEPARLLHVAPEMCLERRLSRLPQLSYHPADRDPRRYWFAGPVCQLDLMALPYADRSFDAIIANHVLEHVPDDKRAISELFRVLRPGGFALLQVPIAQRLARTLEDVPVYTDAERERVYGQRDHLRLYGLDYPERLEQAGFAVRRWARHVEQGPEFVARWLLNPREVVYVATRG